MPPLHYSRALRAALVLTLIISFGLGFLPLFAGPGYEAALATGLYLPGLAAVATALDVAEYRPSPLSALGRGAASATFLWVVALGMSWLFGAAHGFCEPLSGTLLFALGPGMGAVLGGIWGACVGLAAESLPRGWLRRAVSIGLSLAAPLFTILVSLGRFYTSPMVFAFDPFFGYFAGPLYDTVIEPNEPLLSYRAGTLATILFVVVLFCHLRRNEQGGLSFFWPERPGLTLLGLVTLGVSIAHSALGTELGHYSTHTSVQKALGRAVSGQRCDVVYSSILRRRDAEVIARQCEAHVPDLERYFGVKGPERVRVLLFANAHEKATLIGAANTHIAKPWREEVYIQTAAYPHPVLRHELAHVIAGSFGRGPFGIAGPARGFIPDPGRIEGLAVAAAPGVETELTLQQWARAMQKLELLPPLSSIFRLSFLGQNASTAYTVAGAFIEHLAKTQSMSAVRRWYGGEAIAKITGKPLSELEEGWLASLEQVPLDERALHTAEARFDRPAIFGRKCPHEVDELGVAARSALDASNCQRASQLFSRILELDENNFGARYGLIAVDVQKGNLEAARTAFAELSQSEQLNHMEQVAAEQALGDVLFIQDQLKEAARAYARAAKGVVDEDLLRTLDVKRFAALAPQSATGNLTREAIQALLIGQPEEGPSWDLAAAKLGALSTLDEKSGLADYLLGKNLFVRGRYRAAAEYLSRALQRKIALPRVEREAKLVSLKLACALGDRKKGKELYAALLSTSDLSPAQKQGFKRLAELCKLEPK